MDGTPIYSFTINDSNAYVKKDTEGPTLIDITNLMSVDIELLDKRFFADIIKDSQTDNRVTDIVVRLKQCYATHHTKIPDAPAGYKAALTELENTLHTNPAISNNITELKNLVRTSTDGTNSTEISFAEMAVWESGFGTNKICKFSNDPDFVTIGTPGAKLDPLPKEPYTEYFPSNANIVFTGNFTKALGFPNTEISIIDDRVKITYKDNQTVEVEVNHTTTKDVLKTHPSIGKYLLGNREKNAAILNLQTNNCDEFYKYVETKELGDILQVWLYFAYVIINDVSTSEIVMITTDNVVYSFCILLGLSCVYTGSREGVESGCCTLKHYLAGPPDFTLQRDTMIKIHYNRIFAHNSAIKMGLLIIMNDFKKFIYYRLKRNQLVKTYGEYIKRQEQTDIKALFGKLAERIDQLNTHAAAKMVEFLGNQAPENSADATTQFNEFCKAIDDYKCSQLLTKLPDKTYVIQPGLLDSCIQRRVEGNTFDNIDNIAYTIIPVKTDGAAAPVAAANENGMKPLHIPETVLSHSVLPTTEEEEPTAATAAAAVNSINGMSLFSTTIESITTHLGTENTDSTDLQIGGVKPIRGQSHIEQVHYYEYLLMCFIAYKYGFNEINLSTIIELQSLFALIYDNIVSSIKYNTNVRDTVGEYLDKYSDEHIIEMGRKLSIYIYLAEDIEQENDNLKKELSRVYNKKELSRVYNVVQRLREESRKKIFSLPVVPNKRPLSKKFLQTILSGPTKTHKHDPNPHKTGKHARKTGKHARNTGKHGGSRRHHKKLNNIKSKKQRKLRNRNAAIRSPKTRSAPRRLRRVLRRPHATRKKAPRTRY